MGIAGAEEFPTPGYTFLYENKAWAIYGAQAFISGPGFGEHIKRRAVNTAEEKRKGDNPVVITYELGKSLYINITNRCTNDCSFCVRSSAGDNFGGLNLWLEREPTVDEVMEAVVRRDGSQYGEFVFCGYGEPMMRTDDLVALGKALKARYATPVRINTNGQANLICGRDVTPRLAGWVSALSISLNAKNAQDYQKICRSVYGEKAFAAILDFAAKAKQYVPKVIFTVVDVLSEEDIRACAELAQRSGVDFRVRHWGR